MQAIMATGNDQKSSTGSFIKLLIIIRNRITGNRRTVVLRSSFILMLLAMFILPLISVPEYSIIRNTITELGSQSAPYSWIMNLIIVLLSFGSLIAAWRYYEDYTFQRIILLIFVVSFALTAFFHKVPVNAQISNNIVESWWNEYLSGTALLSFIILSISTSLITEKQADKLLALTAGILIILLSVLMSEVSGCAGIWHRFIFIEIFGWQIHTFKNSET